MAEPVNALVEQELLLRYRLAGTEAARDPDHALPRHPREGALDHAVVVAGVAGHRALRQRLRRAALVVREPAVADGVGDLVAVGVHARNGDVVLREQVERPLRAVAVGDVREGPAEAVRRRVLLAGGDRGVVRLESGTRARAPRGLGDEPCEEGDLAGRELAPE